MKKKNRIKKSKEFQELINTGTKLINSSFIMYFKEKKEEECRMGITLSKKIGNAVIRNHIKRQVRMMLNDLVDVKEYPYDCVFIIRHNYLNLAFKDNKNYLEKVMIKATIL